MIVKADRLTQSNVLSPSDKGLRILFLAPFAPQLQASHGGGRAIGQLIAHLSQRHSIALCYVRGAGEPAVDEGLRECCDIVEEVEIPKRTQSGIDRWLRRLQVYGELVSGKPLWAIDRYTPEFEARVRNLLEGWHPDIVQLEFHVMGQYFAALKDDPAPKILVQHEPGADSAREAMRVQLTSGHIMPWLDLLAWKRFERKVMQQVQTVVVFTERDRQSISKMAPEIQTVRIPLGTEIPEFRFKVSEESLSLLFIGNFKHLPNLDAAERLIHQIFPQVQKQFPGARLYIVGDHLPSTLLGQPNENVICTGYVPDVKPYLDKASIVVVPVRLGGGMRVKVLEALAAGKAIVASSRAVEGLDLVDGKQVILAEDDAEFSRAIIQLMSNSHTRDALKTQARAWALENLSWERTVQDYEELYQRLLRDQVLPRGSD